MNNINFFRLKAVATTLFIVIIMGLSSTAVPNMNSSIYSESLESNTLKSTNLKNNYIDKLNNDLIQPLSFESEDFKEYWNHYEKITDWWNLLVAENMEDWDQSSKVTLRTLLLMNAILGITAAVYGSIGTDFLLAFILTTVLAVVDLSYLYYFTQVYQEWFWLIGLSSVIVVHAIDQNGDGIENLDRYIEAYNIEVPTNKKIDFTYPLDSCDEFDGSGWYSTSSWWHVNNLTIWDKTPCPPGFWNISITGLDRYENKYIDKTDEIYKHKTAIINITLFSDPYIPTIHSDDKILDVNEIGTFSFYSEDPDGGEISYQIDWGDGTISNWTDPVPSGQLIMMEHQWDSENIYVINAQTKDSQGEISPMSKNGFTVFIS